MVCVLTELVHPLAGLDRLSLSDDAVAPLVSFDLVRCAAGIDKHPKTEGAVFFELDGRPPPAGQHNDGGATVVYRRVKELMQAFDRRLLELPGALGSLPDGTHVYVHWPALCHQGPSRAGNALSAKTVDSPPDSATPRWLGATRGVELAGQLYVPQDDPQKTLLGAKVVELTISLTAPPPSPPAASAPPSWHRHHRRQLLSRRHRRGLCHRQHCHLQLSFRLARQRHRHRLRLDRHRHRWHRLRF